MPWGTSRAPSESGQADTASEADTHFTDYEPDKRTPLARLGIRVTKNPPKTRQFAQLQQDDYSPKVMASGGVFWIPVAHTLGKRPVGRHVYLLIHQYRDTQSTTRCSTSCDWM